MESGVFIWLHNELTPRQTVTPGGQIGNIVAPSFPRNGGKGTFTRGMNLESDSGYQHLQQSSNETETELQAC